MSDTILELLEFIWNNLFNGIEEFIQGYGGRGDILVAPLNIGFGQVVWITTTVQDILALTLSLTVFIVIIKYTIKFVKWIWSFASRLFGGR